MSKPQIGIVHCSQCELGVASRHGSGQACPFVDRERQADELIYLEGEPAHYAWFVKRGTVVLSREIDDSHGEGRVRAVRFPGSFIGLETLVSSRYIDTARAITPVTLCGAPRQAIDMWLGNRQTPARAALEIELRSACLEVTRRAAPDGNAEKRVAGWLVNEGPTGATLTLPRRVAADLLGMRAETLSRALASLAKKGAIKVTRQDIEILDADQLAEIAGQAGFEV